MSRIRHLEPTDRAALEAALRSDETFRADEINVALELVDEGLAGSKDYRFRIAVGGDAGSERVRGYICYGPTPMTERTYDLYWIVVHADARGRGVAGALIAAMEEDVRPSTSNNRGDGSNASPAFVRVETSQTEGYGAARRLYEKHGYPETARFVDFYKPGDDLIVYYKRLD